LFTNKEETVIIAFLLNNLFRIKSIFSVKANLYLIVDKEALDEDLRVVPLGRPPEFLVLQLNPTSLVVTDPEKRNFDPTKELVFVILVLVVHRQLQHVVNVLHVTVNFKNKNLLKIVKIALKLIRNTMLLRFSVFVDFKKNQSQR
jgi:hypothetical protein